MIDAVGPAERAAYELLLDAPMACLEDVAAQWNRPEDLAAVLAWLDAAGLISVLPGKPSRYQATAAGLILDTLVAEREDALARAHERAIRLASAYRQARTWPAHGDVVEVLSGEREIRLRLNRLHRAAMRELCCLNAPPEPGLSAMLKAGVASRCVYKRAVAGRTGVLPEIEALIAAGQQARTLPEVPLRLYLADDQQAILPVRHQPDGHAAIVVYPSALLDALRKLFEAMWRRAVPLHLSARPPRNPSRRAGTVDSDHLIGLLLSGLTDKAIARHLGVGYRTVQRWIAALMSELNAHNRFQAGVLAALRANGKSGGSNCACGLYLNDPTAWQPE